MDHADRRVTYTEDGGRVVVDGVDARSVLPEEEHASEEQSPHHVRAGSESLEGLPESNTDSRLLMLMGLVNGSDLFSDIDVGGLQLTDPAKVLHSLLAAVVKEKPARGLADPQGTSEKHASRDDLNGKWNDPLLVVNRQSLLNTVLLSRLAFCRSRRRTRGA